VLEMTLVGRGSCLWFWSCFCHVRRIPLEHGRNVSEGYA
jgi:hypothetical protein